MMTGLSDVLLQILLWSFLGIALILSLAVWMFISYSVLRLVAEFIKAYKETKDLDLDDDVESW